MPFDISKRDVLGLGAAVAASGLLPATARSQTNDQQIMSPVEAGQLHQSEVLTLRASIPDKQPFSRENMAAAVSKLRILEIVSEDEREFLEDFVNQFFKVGNLDELLTVLQSMYDNAKDRVNQLTAYISELVISSVTAAKAALTNLDWTTIVATCLRDCRGALDGAASGFALLGGRGAVIGAVIGATTASMAAFAAV